LEEEKARNAQREAARASAKAAAEAATLARELQEATKAEMLTTKAAEERKLAEKTATEVALKDTMGRS